MGVERSFDHVRLAISGLLVEPREKPVVGRQAGVAFADDERIATARTARREVNVAREGLRSSARSGTA